MYELSISPGKTKWIIIINDDITQNVMMILIIENDNLNRVSFFQITNNTKLSFLATTFNSKWSTKCQNGSTKRKKKASYNIMKHTDDAPPPSLRSLQNNPGRGGGGQQFLNRIWVNNTVHGRRGGQPLGGSGPRWTVSSLLPPPNRITDTCEKHYLSSCYIRGSVARIRTTYFCKGFRWSTMEL